MRVAAIAMPQSEVEAHVLLALAVVVAAAWCAGWAISRVRQPRVHGEIVVGILLGPSLLGVIWPSALDYLFPTEVISALKVIAQIGLVLFMFLIGLDLDLDKLRGHGYKAAVISNVSILAPLALGSLLGIWLYPRLGEGVDELGFVLFIGAAMAITAFPVLARVLRETGLDRTRIGVLTMTCAAIDDVSAWCVLAIVVAVVKSDGPTATLRTVALSLLFLLVMRQVVKPLLARMPNVSLWMAIAFALFCGWLTDQIGIHAIFGAFLAGAVMPRRREQQEALRRQIEPTTLTFLLPVFFVVVGLATHINGLNSLYLWAITLLVLVTAIVGKWGGAMLAARATGETWHAAASIGILMNTRGLTELVILSVGLELGVITTTMFTIMVIMALVTTLMATPLLALVSLERVSEGNVRAA